MLSRGGYYNNREESASEIIWRHNQRGEAENWHKELKLGFGMEQLPCGQFDANALFFAIGVLAYNLGLVLKAEVLPAAYRHSTVQILRWQLYRLAGKLVRHGRQWWLKIRTESAKLEVLLAARQKCFALGQQRNRSRGGPLTILTVAGWANRRSCHR